MKIAVGSDDKNKLTDFVISELRKRGHDLEIHGPMADENLEWTDVARIVAEKVNSMECDQGVLFCWTGTGVSIAANKVPGIRAALCKDAETASGARKWNDANVLAMSLISTSEKEAGEILDAWFSSFPEEEERENIDKIKKIEEKYSK